MLEVILHKEGYVAKLAARLCANSHNGLPICCDLSKPAGRYLLNCIMSAILLVYLNTYVTNHDDSRNDYNTHDNDDYDDDDNNASSNNDGSSNDSDDSRAVQGVI